MALPDGSPVADYDNISSVLFPGGINERGRVHGEWLMSQRYGRVIGWFTVTVVPEGHHPEEVKQSWLGVPLPIRDEYAFSAEIVPVYAADAYNALADNRSPVETLEYWAKVFMGRNPVLYFNLPEGTLERNQLIE